MAIYKGDRNQFFDFIPPFLTLTHQTLITQSTVHPLISTMSSATITTAAQSATTFVHMPNTSTTTTTTAPTGITGLSVSSLVFTSDHLEDETDTSTTGLVPRAAASAPTVYVQRFTQREHPWPLHGAGILQFAWSTAPQLSSGDLIRMEDGNPYRLKEWERKSREWVLFRCDRVDEDGKEVKGQIAYAFAVEPSYVKRGFWGRLKRRWFERRFNFCCA
jgi:hypothetical protein